MLPTDTVIGRYRIQRRLASGGMGSLYLALDPVLDRTVAVKFFHGDLDVPDVRDRFVREARAIAALNHPHIVTIYDYGEYSSHPFIVMEYIEGETLAAIIRRRAPVSPMARLGWLEELCSAVAYAHERHIIHRDLKPANLMVDAYGRLKVLDFGIARMRGTLVSRTTAVIGTPGYTAPEQLRGGAIDPRSDLFSIGAVAYALFAYVEPFAGETPHAVTYDVLESEPAPLGEICPWIDPELARLIAHALHKKADERLPSAATFRDGLASIWRRLEVTDSATVLAPRPATVAPPPLPPPPAAAPETPVRPTARHGTGRQRDAQVQGWMQLAREHLAAGEYAEARDACLQALGLAPHHAAARELLNAIEAGARPPAAREAEPHRGGASGGAVPVAVSGDETLYPPPADWDAERFVPPPARDPDPDETVMVPTPSAGTMVSPAPVDRAPTPAADGVAVSAVGVPRPATGTPAGPAPAGLPASAARTAGQAPLAEARTARQAPVVEARTEAPVTRAPAPPVKRPVAHAPFRQRQLVLYALAATAVLLLVVAVVWWATPAPGPPAPVLVVIDATPWATVTRIDREGGDQPVLVEEASTPLPVWLAPGAYRISLLGPPPSMEMREVSVVVEEGSPAVVPLERFSTLTADEYFRAFTGALASADGDGEPVADDAAARQGAP